ncbi:MAG: ketoacyl-ACP synthase III [Desulfarculus sp.]|nr:ketoacyl-ACP synthase III [Desulfarculus sp.]
MGALIIGTGSYVPSRVVTNQDLLEYVDLGNFDQRRSGPYPQWVSKVMGFEERRWAADGQATSDLAYQAARRALDDAGLPARQIDLIVVTTATPDKKTPSTASILQSKLGAGGCSLAFDIGVACSGFVYGLHIAEAMLTHHRAYRHALVVSAEKATSATDIRHYITGATFGDGAGAVVLARSASRAYGILASYATSDGDKEQWVQVPAGGSALPITRQNCEEIFQKGWHCFQLMAQEVKGYAVARVVEAVHRVLAMGGLGLEDVAYLLPHQPGRRILDGVAQALNLPPHQALTNYQRYGNTSQASIPILLDENKHLFRRGDHLVLAGVGGGFGWGAVLYRWGGMAGARRPARRPTGGQA